MDTYTLQNIKDMYYFELSVGDTERRGFTEYLDAKFQPLYDDQLNYLGWALK